MTKSVTQPNRDKLAFSVKELSQLTGISERKIHYEIKNNNLRPSRIGRRVLILFEEAQRWLNQAAQ